MAAQHRRNGKAGQQHHGLPPGLSAPAGDADAVPLQQQQQRGNDRNHRRRRLKAPAAAKLRPAVRRLHKQLRLRSNGLRFRLRLGLRGSVEPLRLLRLSPGEQPSSPGGKKGFGRLFHHRVHSAAHHVLQRHRTGSLGQGHIQNIQFYRGNILFLPGGRRALLRRSPDVPARGGRDRFRGRVRRRRGGRLRGRRGRFNGGSGGLLPRLLQQRLLQTAAELRQDLLQGVVVLGGGNPRDVLRAV